MGGRCSQSIADAASCKPLCSEKHRAFGEQEYTFNGDLYLHPGFPEQESCTGSRPSASMPQVSHVESLKMPSGCVYTGQATRRGQPHGLGTQCWTDGTKYVGMWAHGAAHGQGKLTKPDGTSFDGSWVEGRKQGDGLERMLDGSHYRGEFVDGQKHGRGDFRWSGGDNYVGEFAENAMHGEGLFVWNDGRQYRGQWSQNSMHGRGRFVWPDGTSFDGRYQRDRKQGPGVFSWQDGSTCVGTWQAGKQHGHGTYYDADGNIKKGKWKDGLFVEWLEQSVFAKESAVGVGGALHTSADWEATASTSRRQLTPLFSDELAPATERSESARCG